MHECWECGQACACDGDDLWWDTPPAHCACPCWEEEGADAYLSDEDDTPQEGMP
jgi:hypothetical protein